MVEPEHSWWKTGSRKGTPVADDFRYSSDNNAEWMEISALRDLIDMHEPAIRLVA